MCGCANQPAPVVYNTPVSISTDNSGCSITIEELNNTKDYLLSKKNSENSAYINAQLGLIQTMINVGNYCKYNLGTMMV